MSNITGTLYVQQLSAGTFTPPSSCITDSAIVANASVSASKLEHRHQHAYSQANSATAAADRKVIHIVQGATATVNSFLCGIKGAAVGAATATFDLFKNGSSILSAAVVLNNTYSGYTPAVATVSSPSLVVGDVLEISITVAAGGGTLGTGLYASVQLDEKAN